jgi:hypothetical protein
MAAKSHHFFRANPTATGKSCPTPALSPRYPSVRRFVVLVLSIYLLWLLPSFLGHDFFQLSNMMRGRFWKAFSAACLASTAASYNVLDLSKSQWTVSNPDLNVSVPGSLPSHVSSMFGPFIGVLLTQGRHIWISSMPKS